MYQGCACLQHLGIPAVSEPGTAACTHPSSFCLPEETVGRECRGWELIPAIRGQHTLLSHCPQHACCPLCPCTALHPHTSWGRAALHVPVLHCFLLCAPALHCRQTDVVVTAEIISLPLLKLNAFKNVMAENEVLVSNPVKLRCGDF